jgi:hypothetical protein
MTTTGPGAERLAWTAIPLALVGIVVLLFVIGGLADPRVTRDELDVADVLAVEDPAATYGSAELEIVGWYANLDADCLPHPDDRPAPNWLERTCPLHLLLAEQPAEGATQAALETIGLRLASPGGAPFPPRPQPGGWHLMLEQRIVTGHFDDPAALDCAPERVQDCRNTFVVSDTKGLVHSAFRVDVDAAR